MNHFNQNHDVIPILYDLVVGIIGRVHHWWAGTSHDDATFAQIHVFGSVVATAPQPGFFFTRCYDPLAFSSPGRNSSIRGVEDE